MMGTTGYARQLKIGFMTGAAGTALCLTSPAMAQAAPEAAPAAQDDAGQDKPTKDDGLADIVVTATKRGAAQNVQNVPIAVTAFGAAQLEEQHFQNLQSLSYSMPNVQLTAVGTQPGYATFSIRGFGISSSIPSIDPTVGTFIDGVYMGVNTGVVLNNFDIEGIEVLRGPQACCSGATSPAARW